MLKFTSLKTAALVRVTAVATTLLIQACGGGGAVAQSASDADVIVTWIRVPGDEVELVGRLRNTDATRHTPVIVLTACGSEVEQWRALVAGCDMFLQKPCPPERLVNEIRWVLTHGRLALPQPARAHLNYRNRRAS